MNGSDRVDTVVAGEILDAARKHLASYGLDFTYEELKYRHDPANWKGTLKLGDSSSLVRVVLATPMTLTALSRVGVDDQYLFSPTLPVLVVGRHVHERSAGAFRELGLAYADTVGNAYIRFKGVLIDVRGRRPPHPAPRSAQLEHDAPGPQSSNLFSTGRAQVIATLLTWPELADKSVREVARTAGVSTGQAYSALNLLDQTGYLIDRRLRTDRVDELLDLWTAAYPQGLGQKLAVASYSSGNGIYDLNNDVSSGTPHDPDPDSDSDSDEFALSGESVPGLGVKRPLSLTVYTRDWSPRRAIRHRWRAANSAAEADIHVRRRFWISPTDDHPGTVYDSIAPWPIVYADLIATGDQRLSIIAGEWRNRHRTS